MPQSSVYGTLEKLLLEQLKAPSAPVDLRLQLLDLYFAMRRTDDFLREARIVTRQIPDRSHSKEWQRVATMGRMLAPDSPLFKGDVGDLIEFVAPPEASSRQVRRFGEGYRYASYFESLAKGYEEIRSSPNFFPELDRQLLQLGARPSLLEHASRLSDACGGAQIYFKREDLASQGSHLLINIIGEALVARRLGKSTLVTASGRGKRSIYTATVAARLGMRAIIFVDGSDAHLHSADLLRMRLMGATVSIVEGKTRRHPDLREMALEHAISHQGESFLVMGLEAAPHPYSMLMQDLTGLIGRESLQQLKEYTPNPPDILVARQGNNADAIGFLTPFLQEKGIRLVCVHARSELGMEASSQRALDRFKENIFDPMRNPLTEHQKKLATGILSGLEYPSVSREHAALKATGRIEYVDVVEAAAKKAITDCARLEGYVPPIETSQVIAWACETARTMRRDQAIIVMIAEKAEKDIWDIGKALDLPA